MAKIKRSIKKLKAVEKQQYIDAINFLRKNDYEREYLNNVEAFDYLYLIENPEEYEFCIFNIVLLTAVSNVINNLANIYNVEVVISCSMYNKFWAMYSIKINNSDGLTYTAPAERTHLGALLHFFTLLEKLI